ncbi:MAG: prephenate dehydrogenase [Candidatus Magasanikbacteria bacterium]|nr:prephenate dehydrogenase [Candidatus Magasanikbacteria bacterium]
MRFGVIGYGRFGKLWAQLLRSFGHVLVSEISCESGTQDEGLVFVTLREVVEVDLLFLLVPISAMEDLCRDLEHIIGPKTIVVDACSVKCYPARVMKEYLPQGQEIIATHPLFGPDSVAKFGLEGRQIAVCPVSAKEKNVVFFNSMMKRMGLSVIETTPEEHDKQMARSQALVHFIGRGLGPLELKDQEIATPDYKTLLQMNAMVEHDTWELFYDMQTYNPYAADMRQVFLKELGELETKIEARTHLKNNFEPGF